MVKPKNPLSIVVTLFVGLFICALLFKVYIKRRYKVHMMKLYVSNN
jgi:hypothetical protein